MTHSSRWKVRQTADREPSRARLCSGRTMSNSRSSRCSRRWKMFKAVKMFKALEDVQDVQDVQDGQRFRWMQCLDCLEHLPETLPSPGCSAMSAPTNEATLTAT